MNNKTETYKALKENLPIVSYLVESSNESELSRFLGRVFLERVDCGNAAHSAFRHVLPLDCSSPVVYRIVDMLGVVCQREECLRR